MICLTAIGVLVGLTAGCGGGGNRPRTFAVSIQGVASKLPALDERATRGRLGSFRRPWPRETPETHFRSWEVHRHDLPAMPASRSGKGALDDLGVRQRYLPALRHRTLSETTHGSFVVCALHWAGRRGVDITAPEWSRLTPRFRGIFRGLCCGICAGSAVAAADARERSSLGKYERASRRLRHVAAVARARASGARRTARFLRAGSRRLQMGYLPAPAP
jgi:hypothetical protein